MSPMTSNQPPIVILFIRQFIALTIFASSRNVGFLPQAKDDPIAETSEDPSTVPAVRNCESCDR
jgi:hypothetical protein